MKRNVIRDKSFDFALKIVQLYKTLCADKKEFVMSKQLLRSGTSVGANVREAEHAESKADFIHKLAIAQKEANESEYWIDLLFHSDFIPKEHYEELQFNIKEISKILASIIISSKSRKSN